VSEAVSGLCSLDDFGSISKANVDRDIMKAHAVTKNYSGKRAGQAADYVEQTEFRIFLEIVVFILQGEDNNKIVLGMESLWVGGQYITTTCCGGCVIS